MNGLEMHKREPENAMIEITMQVVAVLRTQGSTLVADPEWQSTDAVIRVERLIDNLAPDGQEGAWLVWSVAYYLGMTEGEPDKVRIETHFASRGNVRPSS